MVGTPKERVKGTPKITHKLPMESLNDLRMIFPFKGLKRTMDRNLLRQFRRNYKRNQKDMAEVFGISLRTYKGLESGKRAPSRTFLTTTVERTLSAMENKR